MSERISFGEENERGDTVHIVWKDTPEDSTILLQDVLASDHPFGVEVGFGYEPSAVHTIDRGIEHWVFVEMDPGDFDLARMDQGRWKLPKFTSNWYMCWVLPRNNEFLS